MLLNVSQFGPLLTDCDMFRKSSSDNTLRVDIISGDSTTVRLRFFFLAGGVGGTISTSDVDLKAWGTSARGGGGLGDRIC